MAKQQEQPKGEKGATISLDTWAVITALAFALLVRLGVIHRVAW
jgi:hypothetical protein